MKRRASPPIVVREAGALARMREAGRVVAEMHAAMRAALRPGVTGNELDRIARAVLEKRGAASNFLGYHGYPATVCVSPDDVIVHGIPGDTPFEEGTLLSIDCGAVVDGYHGDAAFSAVVGVASSEVSALIDAADAALLAGITQMVEGNRLSDIGHHVQRSAEGAGYGVVREYVGHGIGTAMHEPPDVPNFGDPGRGPVLTVGNTLAIEPMITAGSPDTELLADGWTVVTADGGLAAHVEHSVAVGENGPEILTRPLAGW